MQEHGGSWSISRLLFAIARIEALQYALRGPGKTEIGEAWNNLGYCYRKVRDNQKALEAYRRAIELRPDFQSAHEYIGRLYIALGNREMAMRHYEILRRLDPKMAEELRRAIEANNADLDEED
jgi:tetratricopeptide (TPR) repeat protein